MTTLVLFSVAGFVAASRTVSGTVYGFEVAGANDRAVGTVRAATTQIGYLLGSVVGGVALAGAGSTRWRSSTAACSWQPWRCTRASGASAASMQAAAGA